MSAEEQKPQTQTTNPAQRPQGQRPETGAPRPDQRQGGAPRGDPRQGGDRRDRQQNQRPREQRPKRSPEDRNVVFIGNKPPMNYVLAVVTQFNSGSDEVVIRARGKAISQAVDVAEIVRNKFFQKAAVKSVSIGTESVMGDDGRKRAVSAIEIRLNNTDATGAANAGKPSLPQANAPAKPPVEPAMPAKSGGV